MDGAVQRCNLVCTYRAYIYTIIQWLYKPTLTLPLPLPYLILPVTVAAAAGRARQVPARAGRLHRQFRRRVSGDSSSKPDAVVADTWRHSVAPVLADVWRTVS